MRWKEGQEAVFEGIATDDGPEPGDRATIMILGGSGAWIRMDTGPRAGTMSLVWLDDLEPVQEHPDDITATVRGSEP